MDNNFNNSNFGNTEQREYVKQDVNTNSIMYFNNDNIMFKETFYNTFISFDLRFGEMDPMTGKNKYSAEKAIKCALLSHERCVAFEEHINKVFLPKVAAGEKYNFGIFTNKQETNMVLLMYDGTDISIHFCLGIGSDRKPKDIYVYKFEKIPYIENYNSQTGEFENSPLIESQFVLFIKSIQAFNSAMTNAENHADRYFNNWFRTNYMSSLNDISMKLGCTPRFKISSSNGYSKSGGFNSGFNSNNTGNAFSSNGGFPNQQNEQNVAITAQETSLENLLGGDEPF